MNYTTFDFLNIFYSFCILHKNKTNYMLTGIQQYITEVSPTRQECNHFCGTLVETKRNWLF